jgi:hypothetical protein
MKPLTDRLKDETGAALAMAMAILLIMGLSVGAAISAGIGTDDVSVRDSLSKQATEAAEAGLQVALYRLNMLNPSAGYCVGNAVAGPDATGNCASSAYTLSNGATYQYYTTPALPTSSTCVGATITNGDVNQRCITAVGTVSGVTARSQIRAAAFAAEPLFPEGGLIGLNGVSLSGNSRVTGTVASNGTIAASGNVTISAVVLGPAGSFQHSGNISWGSESTLSSPIVLSPVNPGTSNQTSLAQCPARVAAGYPSCNDDYRITNGLASPAVSPYDQASSVTFNAGTRTLTMSGNSSLTLGGGLYNFCQINASGNATITIAATASTEIIIDSPSDPGSGCPSGTGGLAMSGNVTWSNLSGNPTALQLLIYGSSSGSSASFSGNSNFTGVIFAPQTAIALSGNATFTGAIAGKTVSVSGNGVNWDSRVASLQASASGLYYRTAWAQCTPTYAAISPGSNCG